MLLQDTAEMLDALNAIRRLGVGIAMDDFGTGYSSLGYLHRFPFDRIKIDRSFVAGLRSRPQAAAIVGAIVSLGRNLGMRTTAEGVEHEAQVAQLRAQGCSEAQGYFFSHPVANHEVPDLIAADRQLQSARA
jgi:EAL domain-containing protein (putative c-di-GMP-specific phosphodiesterase class I)